MFAHRINDAESLQLLEPHHAREVFELVDRNRARLREWFIWVDAVREVEDTRQFIQKSLAEFASNGAFSAGIVLEGRIVGVIGPHAIDMRNRKCSLGYWLDGDAQGRGIMTRACRAVVTHLFENLQLERVVIYCAAENHRSRAVAQRLGFACEGVHRRAEWLYDHFVDLASYAALREEWLAAQK
ncbi:MAG TPA: GNAT family N-acetyltransferase [Tepidisphaeraceae bacterium]|nr:GNAT family N-acetyltransferase [Tepidisphaeraceae bacterium]